MTSVLKERLKAPLFETTRARSTLKLKWPGKTGLGTESRRIEHFLFNRKPYVCYSDDFETFLAGLIRRVLCPLPDAIPGPWWKRMAKDAGKFARSLVFGYGCRLLDMQQIREYIEKHYHGSKKREYLEALADLERCPLMETRFKDSKITAFSKQEFIALKEEMSKRKPRIIQFRPYRWLVYFFMMKEVEHALYRCRGLFNPLDPTQEVAKNCNPRQRGVFLHAKARQLKRPWAILWDGSNWDAHVNATALKLEKSFYLSALSAMGATHSQIRDFNTLFDMQIDNKGQARFDGGGRVNYTIYGNRMSGDWNTSFGNVILMCLFTVEALRSLGIPLEAWRIFDDGDDCILLVEQEYVQLLVENLASEFLKFGQEIVVEEPVDLSQGIEGIEFCQSHPVLINGEYTMVRSYSKMFNTYFQNYRWFKTPSMTRDFFNSVGLADAILYAGAPIVSVLARRMHKLGGGRKYDKKELDKYGIWRFSGVDLSGQMTLEIDEESRLSYQKAFGLDPAMQVTLEYYINAIELP